MTATLLLSLLLITSSGRSLDAACRKLLGLHELEDRDRLVTARTCAARAEAAREAVAVFAVLLAEKAGLAARTLVDGVDISDEGLLRCLAAAAPDRLTAGVRAVAPAARAREGLAADLTGGHRLSIVTHGLHAALSSARSTNTLLWKTVPARTRATSWGR